jgi:hypothetical protein
MAQSVTCASGTAALLAEVTMPVIEPYSSARAGADARSIKIIAASIPDAFIGNIYEIIYI